MRHSGRTDLSIVLTGGLRTPSDALVGPVADAAVRSMHVDLLFMGVHGMEERGGFTTPNLLEAETNGALVRSAGQLVVVADHTKWGIVGLSTIAALSEADVLVTDDGLSPTRGAALGEHVGRLVVAGAPGRELSRLAGRPARGRRRRARAARRPRRSRRSARRSTSPGWPPCSARPTAPT